MIAGFTDTIVIVRPGTATGTYGDPVADWDDTTRTKVEGVSVQPRTQTQSSGAAGTVNVGDYALASPMGAGDIPLASSDRVEFGALLLEVVGEPKRWRSMTSGEITKVEATLRTAS